MNQTPKWWPNLAADVPVSSQQAHKVTFTTLNQHDDAIASLKSQVDALGNKVGVNTKAVATNATAAAAATNGAASVQSVLGKVDNQTGTSYTLQDSDYGGIVTFSNASPVAVLLSDRLMQFWFAALENLGPSVVTLMPDTSLRPMTVNNTGSLALAAGASAWLFFDGINWWAATVSQGLTPANTPAVAHQFFAAYNATTGLFAQVQPGEGDVVNLVSDLAAKAPLASPTFTGMVTQPGPDVLTAAATASTATPGAASALPSAPAGYLVLSINGTNFKVPYFAM